MVPRLHSVKYKTEGPATWLGVGQARSPAVSEMRPIPLSRAVVLDSSWEGWVGLGVWREWSCC
jgi:hypothetical protein